MVYGENCPACDYAAPEFAIASTKIDGLIQFAAVNISDQTELGSRLQIAHVPMFIIYHSTGTNDFTGTRNSEQFLRAVTRYAPACLEEFHPDWLKESQHSAVLFLNGPAPPLPWKVFSCKSPGIRVGISTDAQLRHSLGATLAPAPFLINGTHTISFKDVQSAINNSAAFFKGVYVKPKPAVEFFLPFELSSECRAPTQLCIGHFSELITGEFRALAEEYLDKNMKFFQGDDDWPVPQFRMGTMALFKPNSRFCYIVHNPKDVRPAIAEALSNPRNVAWIKF
jgi:thiol-disulfide isomerase/thioredoxin